MPNIEHELAALLAAEDPRSIADMKAADHYEEGILTEVTPYKDGDGYSLGYDSMGLGITAERNPNGVVPEVGQTIRVYGPGFGSPFHGVDIDGREVFWLTPLERVADRVVWLAKHDRDKRERAVRYAPKIASDYESLSAPLRARIDRFRAEKPTFGMDSEAYEMFACVEADKIAAYLRPRVDAGETPANVVASFRDLPYDEQIAAGLSDQHSGNTFGGACMMAQRLLAGEPV